MTWALFPGDEDRGWRLLSDTGGDPVEWPREFGAWNHTMAIAFEGTIPIPPDTNLIFTVELRSRADQQTLYWGRYPLHEHPDQDGWGLLTLPAETDASAR